MAHEFKPGDLALIIRSRSGLNLGKCVTVEKKLEIGDRVPLCGNIVLRAAVGGWLVSGDLEDLIQGRHYKFEMHGFEDKALMPLKGDEQPTQVRQVERVQ